MIIFNIKRFKRCYFVKSHAFVITSKLADCMIISRLCYIDIQWLFINIASDALKSAPKIIWIEMIRMTMRNDTMMNISQIETVI